MKRFLFISVFIFTCTASQSQIRFQHVIGGPGNDDAQEIIQTPDGGYLTCGTTDGFGSGQSDILVTCTNDSGVVQWSKAYGSPGNDFGVGINIAPAGGFIIAGYSNGFSADTLTDDFLLIKITGSGNLEWAKTYGDTLNEEAHAICVMPDSGFIIAGTTNSFSTSTIRQGFIVRTDKYGNRLWSKLLHSFNIDQQLYSVEATNDGGSIVAGYAYAGSQSQINVLIARIDSNGIKQWINVYGGAFPNNQNEEVFSIKKSLTGGFIATGYTSSYGSGQEDAFILRLDEGGGISWSRTYGSSAVERGKTISWGTGNGIEIAGYTKVNGKDKNFLLRTDTSGNVQWSKTYGPSLNVSDANSTAPCNDGGYVMAGLTEDSSAQQSDVYVVKVDSAGSTGCYEAGAQIVSSFFSWGQGGSGGFLAMGGIENTVTVITSNAPVQTNILCNSTGVGINELGDDIQLSVFPNPTNDYFTLTLPENTGGEIRIQLFDVTGKICSEYNREYNSAGIQVPVSNLSNGFYFAKVTTKFTTLTGSVMIHK